MFLFSKKKAEQEKLQKEQTQKQKTKQKFVVFFFWEKKNRTENGEKTTAETKTVIKKTGTCFVVLSVS